VGTLDCRFAPRLLLLLVGALFAKGRRTVTSWFRIADITSQFRLAYKALWAAGRHADALAYPTARFGRLTVRISQKVQLASVAGAFWFIMA
jgi:hypothetical protein